MKRFGACLLALLMLVGCTSQQPGETEDASRLILDSSYVLIFSDDTGREAAAAFNEIYAAATGVTLKMGRDTETEKADREIVFGKTNRAGAYKVDDTTLVSNAFVLACAEKRVFIAATSPEGYDAAIDEFFKQTLGFENVDSVVKTDKQPALPANFELRTEPSGEYEPGKMASGISYRVEGAEKELLNYYIFTESVTYSFDPAISGSFNAYTLTYSTGAYLKGEMTCHSGSESWTEEFFLEPGQKMQFTSLLNVALKGGKADSVTSVKFTILKGDRANLLVEDLSLTARELPDDDVIYISDGKYKLGVTLLWGGGVSYLEDLADGDHNITNLLNDHDTGRLIQQSFYGTNRTPYQPAYFGETLWCYNPVQGGDQYGNHSKLVDFRIAEDGKSIYVKCQPLDWAQKNMLTPSYMENTYMIEDGYVKVANRFIDFSGYIHRNAHQELPAFYTISYLSDFVYYEGTNGWANEELTVKKNLPFWAGNQDAYFNLSSKETWCAWVTPEGYGVGVYTPVAKILLAGRYGDNNSKDSSNDHTNYVSPLITYKLKTLDAFQYSYYITTGSVEEIRSTFKEIGQK
ncbi:MAG: hypothetical protein IJY82_02405 [Oscillospiraceae bacterium]|nr:hypothetical protein [Oscillospiraceae bacterium]